jgi:hypothetical protein
MAREATLTISVTDMPAMKQLLHGLNTEVERGRCLLAALEAELARVHEGIGHVLNSLEADPCTCVYEWETNGTDPCERCLRIAWLTIPTPVEMDAIGQGYAEPSSVPPVSLDDLLRQAAAE